MNRYKLYQVKGKLLKDFGFMELSFLESLGKTVNLDNYDMVYEGEFNSKVPNVLEELYRIFNIDHPNDFYGRSMSVSDIVQIGNDYFYCDSMTWENIKTQLKS